MTRFGPLPRRARVSSAVRKTGPSGSHGGTVALVWEGKSESKMDDDWGYPLWNLQIEVIEDYHHGFICFSTFSRSKQRILGDWTMLNHRVFEWDQVWCHQIWWIREILCWNSHLLPRVTRRHWCQRRLVQLQSFTGHLRAAARMLDDLGNLHMGDPAGPVGVFNFHNGILNNGGTLILITVDP